VSVVPGPLKFPFFCPICSHDPAEQKSSFLVQNTNLSPCPFIGPSRSHMASIRPLGDGPLLTADCTLLWLRHLNGRYVCFFVFLYRNSGPSLGKNGSPFPPLSICGSTSTGHDFAYVLLVMAQGAGTRLSFQFRRSASAPRLYCTIVDGEHFRISSANLSLYGIIFRHNGGFPPHKHVLSPLCTCRSTRG
jgi:hypothetical protein